MSQLPTSPVIQQLFIHAQAPRQQGDLSGAEAAYQTLLEQCPQHFDAHFQQGILFWQTGRFAESLASLTAARKLDASSAALHFHLGLAYEELSRPAEALAAYEQAIAIDAKVAAGWNNRGNALKTLERFAEAVESYDQALALKPDHAFAWANRASVLLSLSRPVEALESARCACAIQPTLAQAHYYCGEAESRLNHHEAAILHYDQAIFLKPDYPEALSNRGNALYVLGRKQEALASFDQAISFNPGLAEAWSNRGGVLSDLGHFAEALQSSDEAILLAPGSAKAHCNRGNVLLALQRPKEALSSYDKAIRLDPELAEAWSNRGAPLSELMRPDGAFESYSRALALSPDYEFLGGDYLSAKTKLCHWENLSEEIARYTENMAAGKPVTQPFSALALVDQPALHQQAAAIYAARKYPQNAALGPLPPRMPGDKIRVGYFSADFHNHATAYLMAGLFEIHDRERFEFYAFSFGPNAHDAMRTRLAASFEQFNDVRDLRDVEIAALARETGIDIAVDLKGYTRDSRPGIFAARAAPVQVNYLGYPGTLGADYIDYVIADATVIPAENHRYFTEKVVSLPDCYQVNDAHRVISDRRFSREELGLPETGFVFCCFNNNYKILPDVFDGWMRILQAVPGSVLWLFEDNPTAAANLTREAEKRGVTGNRLVFAKRLPLADHLARHRLADLFLDTLPYNAHTTASDALWAGLPVLTRPGQSFASRVAASLLQAVGLPEMIVETQEEYEATAIALARAPERLQALKAKLAANRLTTPLFDTPRFARQIEAAYQTMFERHQAGLPPEAFAVRM